MNNLNEVLLTIWQQFTQAENDKKHPFRFGTLGTVNKNGANMRTVVIRKVLKAENELWLYTDIRTPKVQEIECNSAISWHFYHQNQQTQIRLYGTAKIIHNQAINHRIWNELPNYGKTDYLTKSAPGSIKDETNTEHISTNDAQYFCIIKTKIDSIDWLQLNRNGHLRAGFDFINQEWIGKWLIP
jgi:general stress protein 26